ncbi:Uncharacterised protein [Legionella pneumophila]|nr:Uncharacterised protein [Legionella pneumophila]
MFCTAISSANLETVKICSSRGIRCMVMMISSVIIKLDALTILSFSSVNGHCLSTRFHSALDTLDVQVLELSQLCNNADNPMPALVSCLVLSASVAVLT